jgi:hypothetical protein
VFYAGDTCRSACDLRGPGLPPAQVATCSATGQWLASPPCRAVQPEPLSGSHLFFHGQLPSWASALSMARQYSFRGVPGQLPAVRTAALDAALCANNTYHHFTAGLATGMGDVCYSSEACLAAVTLARFRHRQYYWLDATTAGATSPELFWDDGPRPGLYSNFVAGQPDSGLGAVLVNCTAGVPAWCDARVLCVSQ